MAGVWSIASCHAPLAWWSSQVTSMKGLVVLLRAMTRKPYIDNVDVLSTVRN